MRILKKFLTVITTGTILGTVGYMNVSAAVWGSSQNGFKWKLSVK